MELPMRTIVTIHPSGKRTEETINKEQWFGCPCVYPGLPVCNCDGECPCRKVSANRSQTTDAWDKPFN